MAGIRDIKRRIQAVKNIQHVTRAMKMVAAARLRRAQSQVWAARPYSQKIAEVVGRLVLAPKAQGLLLVAPREVKKVGYVLITGDRGLAGAYNASLISLAGECLHKEERPAALVVVGRKGAQYFKQRQVEILDYLVDIKDDSGLIQARELARQLMEFFLSGRLDEVNLIYSRFQSALNHAPRVDRLLPLLTPLQEEVEETDYIYEPEPLGILEAILPRYCEVKVYQALLEARASEHSARMVAMDSATGNAGEMIEELTLSFNKARQAAITTEILEVASGAEALKAWK